MTAREFFATQSVKANLTKRTARGNDFFKRGRFDRHGRSLSASRVTIDYCRSFPLLEIDRECLKAAVSQQRLSLQIAS